ncbi:ribosomal protein S5 domain 2-type protein [Multifurca ochricompacta]|uniref:Ribosomal RNA-processing protein 43 n=1 Tax=Multifurca ochricompacta TaxID=376703 RepID=A0AAD4M598_9AGAM|nr:ribosomal protein S5 domain 2-type protein [Multifurca ochricompacta]
MALQTQTGTSTDLNAQIFQRLHPRAYLERFIKEDIRPDGREATEWRDLSVHVGSISTANGSALVRLGDTTVICGVKAEIAEPDLERPKEGFLVPNIDLPALCGPRFKPGPPSEEAQVLSDRLASTITAAGVLPLSALCIHPERAVWVLYVDATCINYDGNVFDAALIAMVAALKNTTLPTATFNEETGRTMCSRKLRKPLPLECLPVSYTFGVFDGTTVLADPAAFEEPLLDTSISIVLDEGGALLSAGQLGIADKDTMSMCVSAAKERLETYGREIYAFLE